MKGGALLFGVTADGRRGPFGVRGEEEAPDHEQQAPNTPHADQPRGGAEEHSTGQSR